MKASNIEYKANAEFTTVESALVTGIHAVNNDEAIRYSTAVLKKYGRLEAQPTVTPGKFGEWSVQYSPKS